MTRDTNDLNRRDFIKTGVAAAGAATLATTGANRADAREIVGSFEGMPTVKLPRGGVEVPIFGLGTSVLKPLAEKAETRQEAIDIVRYAYDNGVRFFDTAALYVANPTVVEALKDVYDDIYLATKTHAKGPDGAKMARTHVEGELRRLGRDGPLDCVRIHNTTFVDSALGVLDELEKMREEGKILNLGLTTHIHFETAYKLVDTGRLDELLLAKGYFPKGMVELQSQRNREFLELAIARAHQLGMNIVGMKCLSGGFMGFGAERYAPNYADVEKRKQLTAAAIRWAYSDQRFHLWAVGGKRFSDIDENLATFKGDMTLTADDLMTLADFSAQAWGSDYIKGLEEPFKYDDSPQYIEKPLRGRMRLYYPDRVPS